MLLGLSLQGKGDGCAVQEILGGNKEYFRTSAGMSEASWLHGRCKLHGRVILHIFKEWVMGDTLQFIAAN
jgi:hypothetical protein